MRQLYLAVVLPKITYGLDIWYTPPYKPVGFTKNTGLVNMLRSLQKTQRLASTAITGTLCTAPTDLLDACVGILPMELALLKACHRVIVHAYTVPSTHPLYQIIQQVKRNPPTKHLSSIDQLIKIFNLYNTKIETISLTPQTNIAQTREDSILIEKNNIADYRIYSDGSGQEDSIGAAVILYKKNQAHSVKELQAYMGPPTEHNTYEVEATGAILAAWILKLTLETIGKTVTLYIDNQAFIKTLSKMKSTPGQHLINNFKRSVNKLQCKLTIRWISSHSEVKGNKAADKIAKDTASGRSSRSTDLPRILRSPLPISVSATKQEYHAKLQRIWADSWLASPRKSRFSQINNNFPFRNISTNSPETKQVL